MIAIAGPDIPQELLMATGRFAGPLGFDPERATPQADRWLESKFAPWTRSLLEAWFNGEYDGIDQVVFSRADDSSQRLYYYLCELQRRNVIAGPEPLILDIAKIDRASSLDRTIAKLRQLADRLAIGPVALEEAIVQANIARADRPTEPSGNCVLIIGSPAPDDRLANVVRQAGFVPRGMNVTEAWTDAGERVEERTGDPIAALGRWIYNRKSGPRSFADPAAALTDSIRQASPRAVILWRIEEEEAQCWHLPEERKAIAASGLPALIMTRRRWLGDDGAFSEIEAFMQELAA